MRTLLFWVAYLYFAEKMQMVPTVLIALTFMFFMFLDVTELSMKISWKGKKPS